MFSKERCDKQIETVNKEIWKDLSVSKFCALRYLVLLLQENGDSGSDDRSNNPMENPPSMEEQTQVESDVQYPTSNIKKKSQKFPSLQTNPNIWAFLTQVSQDINRSKIIKSPNANVNPTQIAALKNLSKNPDLIIKPSDKGGNVVLMSALQYRNMCWDILKNKHWYKPIPEEVVEQFNQEFNESIFHAYTEGIINKDIYCMRAFRYHTILCPIKNT